MLLVVAGFDQVFPMEKLFLFSPTELQMILCGDQSPQWTKDDIINYTEPKLGYTRERSVSVLYCTMDLNNRASVYLVLLSVVCLCLIQTSSKVKSFPSHMGPWGGADIRFL